MQWSSSFVVRYNGWLSTIVVSFKLEGPVFDSVIRVDTMDNKPGSFLLSMHAKQLAREKWHLKFELSGYQIGIFWVLKPSGKILKIG